MPVNRTVRNAVFTQVFQFDLMTPGVQKVEGSDGYKLVFYALPNVTFACKQLGVSKDILERAALTTACKLAAQLCGIDVKCFTNPHYVYPGPYIIVEFATMVDNALVNNNWKKLPKKERMW